MVFLVAIPIAVIKDSVDSCSPDVMTCVEKKEDSSSLNILNLMINFFLFSMRHCIVAKKGHYNVENRRV